MNILDAKINKPIIRLDGSLNEETSDLRVIICL